MSVSSVGSVNPYDYLQFPPLTGIGNADKSGPPSDPLQALFNAATGGPSSDPLLAPNSDLGSLALGPSISPDTMSTLLSVQSQQTPSGPSPLQSLFGKFDTDGDGKISQSEFEQAVGPNADQSKVDALFAKLDVNGDGSVTQDELKSALHKAHGHHHHHHADQSTSAQPNDPLASLLSNTQANGSTCQSVANPDGSTTMTITYADGTKIAMTSPVKAGDTASTPTDTSSPAASANPAGPSLQVFLEQMISMQAAMFAPPTTDLSV